MTSLFDLKDKNAIITGSSKGIGKAIAYRMAEHGARVIITSRKIDACEEVANEINSQFGADKAKAIVCNIGDKEQIKNLYTKSKEFYGETSTLVCNAAINPYFGPSMNISDEAFEKTMKSNVQVIFGCAMKFFQIWFQENLDLL